MVEKFIKFIIDNRVIVVLIFVGIAVLSLLSIKYSRIDAIPDLGENQQIVFAEWPGRSPSDMEEQVTYPLSNLMQGIPGVKNIRGISAFGFSTVYVIFQNDIDFYWSRSRVLEKISTAGDILPSSVTAKMGPDATGLGQVLWYTLENDPDSKNPKSLAELRSIQDWYIKYHLQSVDGVSEVASVGGFVKEYQIDVDPIKLFARNIHFSALLEAVKNSNLDIGAEVIEDGDREMIIRGLGFFRSIEDIENVVISVKSGVPVMLKDVANVNIGAAFRRGVLDKDGQETVGGVVTIRYGTNPKDVIDRVKLKLNEIAPGLPEGVNIIPFYDRTEIITKVINTVFHSLIQEIITTILVIIFFVLHFRSSLLVSLTLPFGVGISFILMYIAGIDSNVMSLAGLVIAIGTMVDMGIIVTENIHRELSSNTDRSISNSLIIISSSASVFKAVVVSVLTTIVTFLPIFALQGSEGKLFIPLAWTKSFALFGSLIVAIILIPVLSTYLLKGKLKPIEENKVSRFMIKIYEPALRYAIEKKTTLMLLIIPLIVFVISTFCYTRLGSEFMPSLNEGDILYMPVTTPDVSITKAKELLRYTDKVIASHPLVESSIGKLGRASTSLDPAPIAMIETVIRLKDKSLWPPGKSIYDIQNELDDMLQVPSLVNSWNFPIQTRINMISTGIKTDVGVKIFGTDLEKLEELALRVSAVLLKIKGAYGVYAERITGKPYIEFNIDRVEASRYGINTGTINNVIQTAIGGMKLGEFYENRERYPIRVRYHKELRNNIEKLKNVLVPSPLGQHIPISQLSDIKIVTGPAMIQSENGLLRALVLLNVKDRDLVGFVNEAQKAVSDNIKLPDRYSISWAGEYENQVNATRRLMLVIPLSILISFLIIYAGLRSLRNSMIVLTALPVSMTGGIILLYLTGTNLSVAVWVGFIALFGIAVEDGIVMVTYINEYISKKSPKTLQELRDCIVEAGCRRLRPLVMTTTTTIFALFPLFWSVGTGVEIMRPMALPIVGGMSIILLTLISTPVIYSYLEEMKYKNYDL